MNFRDICDTLESNAFGGSIKIVVCFQKEVHPVVSGKSKKATDINENLIHSKQCMLYYSHLTSNNK